MDPNIRWRIRTVRADVAMSGKSRERAARDLLRAVEPESTQSVNPPFDDRPAERLSPPSPTSSPTSLSDGLGRAPADARRSSTAATQVLRRQRRPSSTASTSSPTATASTASSRGAVVGSPAFAPRPSGLLTLPKGHRCALEREADVPQRRRPGDDVHRRLRVADAERVAAAGRADDEPSLRDSVHASAGGADLAGPRDARAERERDHGRR